MYEYELQKQVNGDQWAVGKKFRANDDEEAAQIAVEWINFQRLYYGEGRVRIIKTVFAGNIRQLGYTIEDNEDYTKIREADIAAKAEMFLRMRESEDNENSS